MKLGRYKLLTQLGAGWDGILYKAQDEADGSLAEVRLLTGARVDANRWKPLVKRLRSVEMLQHPSVIRMCALDLDSNPPYAALEWVETTSLYEQLRERLPLETMQALTLTRTLAAALAAGHRLGLAHAKLCPSNIRLSGAEPKIDFTATDTRFQAPEAVKEIDDACQAPRKPGDSAGDASADVYSLGAILCWLLTGKPLARPHTDSAPAHLGSTQANLKIAKLPPVVEEPLTLLMDELLAGDPTARPSARAVEERVLRIQETVAACNALGTTSEFSSVGVKPARPLVEATELGRSQLGRFRIIDKLGEGGMGTVYKAEDATDGTLVAIKVLRSDWARRPDAIRRFHKEARLLAEVNNPYVTSLLEVNEDEGIHYLAIEFVAGKSVGELLEERGRLDEPLALAIMADVARALVDAHARGIVHRDIKPDNILLIRSQESGVRGQESGARGQESMGAKSLTPDSWSLTPDSPRVKLSDFGLARHVEQTESLNVTQTGTVVGTPLYMAPEQCTSDAKVDPRTDIYAMGATLFHLLSGRPPFLGDSPLTIIMMHANDPLPALHKLNPALSEGVCRVVDKTLAKSPEARYAHAAELLAEFERLLRGEPTSIAVHPRLPNCDPKNVVEYDFTWELDSSPAELWPFVSNTERLNRAVGLPAVQFSVETDSERRLARFGKFRKAGMTASWQEHPFEWIEARRMGVLREFRQGPFKWFVSIVELNPRLGGGTTLTHRIRLEPHGLIGRTLAAVEVGIKARKSLEKVYRRIDAAINGKLGSQFWVDAFEDPASLSGARRKRLDGLLEKLVERHVDPEVAERLGDFVAEAPAQEVARIRPLALARRLALSPDGVVAACLHGAREGLFQLMWDILCPICRIPSQVKDTLRALRDHGHCEACNLDFDLDFANSVEMIFRVHPEIRDSELGVYCIGGPAHSPHVVAQARVRAGERIELDLALTEGSYRLRGPQLPFTLDFRVEPRAPTARWDMRLSHGLDPDLPRSLKTGNQLLALTNDFQQEVVVRVERTAARDDALTAARAAALALFRELFPAEILAPGQLISVATVALLVTDLADSSRIYEELGDTRAFGVLHEHFRLLDERIRREGGAIVKAVGDGVLAAFSESIAAVRAGIDLAKVLDTSETTKHLKLRVGIHRGAAMVATLNDHLDYFGTMVNAATQLPGLVDGREVALANAVAVDPQVAALLQTRGLHSDIIDARLPGSDGVVHRVREK